MRQVITGLFFLSTLCCAPCASAEDAPSPSASQNEAWVADAATIAHIRDIVAHSDGADGVFVVNDDGSVKHIQSGMVCPPKFPNVAFWHAEVFSSSLGKGMDVGCDYGRNGVGDQWVSKLTIFATKAPDGMTLDQAFGDYREQVTKVSPDAVSRGEALKIENKGGNPPDIRSEEFSVTRNGVAYTTDLLVSIQRGWILEIRATYPGATGAVTLPKGVTVNDAVLMIGDYAMLGAALVHVVDSIGKQP